MGPRCSYGFSMPRRRSLQGLYAARARIALRLLVRELEFCSALRSSAVVLAASTMARLDLLASKLHIRTAGRR